MDCAMISGSESRTCCREKSAMSGPRPGIIADSSRRCFIDTVREFPGATCQSDSGIGRTPIDGSAAGPRRGVWQRLFEHLAADADNEYAMIDSTIVRAHQHSAGAPKKR